MNTMQCGLDFGLRACHIVSEHVLEQYGVKTEYRIDRYPVGATEPETEKDFAANLSMGQSCDKTLVA